MGLPYHDDMQDWPLEVTDSERIENYVQLYDRAPDAKRVVIMEMLLQATTEQSNSKKLRLAWEKIEALLNQNASLDASTAQYWCLWDLDEQAFKRSCFPYITLHTSLVGS
jgi:hypothetical protein